MPDEEHASALAVQAQHTPEDAAAFLRHLECAPRGFGASSALTFAQQLRGAGDGPLFLFVLGEPLSGKSTFLSNLLTWLSTHPLQVKLISWGDAMRAQRHLGLLPADRVPGDLSDTEFANLSSFVGEQIRAAAAAGRGRLLVVAEVPGCTAVIADNHIDGLDRGFSTCRAFVQDERAYYVALAAEPRLRAMFLHSRETAPGDATSARSATPLAANRINQQVSELMVKLHATDRLELPGIAPGQFGAMFSPNSTERDRVVFEYFLPYLLAEEVGVPSKRALVARNLLVPESMRAVAQADTPFIDQFDYIRERYNV